MNWGHPERGKVLLLAGDFVLATVGVCLAAILHGGIAINLSRRVGLVAVFILAYSICFYVFDLYDVQSLNVPRMLTRLLASAVLGTCLLSLFLYLFQWPGFSRSSMGVSVSF